MPITVLEESEFKANKMALVWLTESYGSETSAPTICQATRISAQRTHDLAKTLHLDEEHRSLD